MTPEVDGRDELYATQLGPFGQSRGFPSDKSLWRCTWDEARVRPDEWATLPLTDWQSDVLVFAPGPRPSGVEERGLRDAHARAPRH